MGSSLSFLASCKSSVGGELLPVPTSGLKMDSTEISTIIKNSLRIADRTRVNLNDGSYYAIPLMDIKKFLLVDATNWHIYKKELFDCDDFALVLLGRNREWFSKANIQDASTFGVAIGDIRRYETDTTPRYHALNFIITDDKKLYLIEPQNDSVYEPTSNSTFTFAWC
jgi:hypothetical protein